MQEEELQVLTQVICWDPTPQTGNLHLFPIFRREGLVWEVKTRQKPVFICIFNKLSSVHSIFHPSSSTRTAFKTKHSNPSLSHVFSKGYFSSYQPQDLCGEPNKLFLDVYDKQKQGISSKTHLNDLPAQQEAFGLGPHHILCLKQSCRSSPILQALTWKVKEKKK